MGFYPYLLTQIVIIASMFYQAYRTERKKSKLKETAFTYQSQQE